MNSSLHLENELSHLSKIFNENVNQITYARDADLTINDYSNTNALLFSQGSWSLICRDLELAGFTSSCIESLSATSTAPCASIIEAFKIRRELIHYKKVCLHLFQEARRIETSLKQAVSFFYWDDGEEAEAGARAHLIALHSTNDELIRAVRRHEAGENDDEKVKCNLLDRKMLYVGATKAWMRHRGISKAIQDARDLSKAICMSPRHPDGERPTKLANLPSSMLVAQIYESAQAHLETGNCRKISEDGTQQSISVARIHAKKDLGMNEKGINLTSNHCYGYSSTQRVLKAVETELCWPRQAIDFLSKSITARGGFKALAMVEELQHYCQSLSDLLLNLREIHKRYQHLQDEENILITHDNTLNHSERINSTLSIAVQRHGYIHQLKGALEACQENFKWVSVLESLISTSSQHVNNKDIDLLTSNSTFNNNTRIFVASDAVIEGHACAFVPQDFRFSSILSTSREFLDQILLPAMHAAIEQEGWPPSRHSKRKRVLAFDKVALCHASISRKKLHRCQSCSGYFNSRWMSSKHSWCTPCEELQRKKILKCSTENNDRIQKQCIFPDCKLGPTAFCYHSGRCFVCDAPHSCEKLCRLSRGGGEEALSLVETIRPKLLLLDFDRTLASTKAGASPLPNKNFQNRVSKGRIKDCRGHSIDVNLKSAVFAQQTFGSSHVITRNSHKSDIQEFLRMHKMFELANNVNIIPKKKSKGSFIREKFYGDQYCQKNLDLAGTNKTCLFIDDDIRELTCDDWLCNDANVHRFLFARGFSIS